MTNISQHVPTKQACLKMKELGFPQPPTTEGLLYWTESVIGNYHVRTSDCIDEREGTALIKNVICFAPLATEILEELPKHITLRWKNKYNLEVKESCKLHMTYQVDGETSYTYVSYRNVCIGTIDGDPIIQRNRSMIEALALMWIYLKENKLIGGE